MNNKGYLFISNSTKPSIETLESVEPMGPSSFSKAAIMAAEEMGWELHMGINRNNPEKIKSIGFDLKFYNQHSYRSIFAFRDNWIAYKNLCCYLKDNTQIEIIHCNTPIGGIVGRLAGKRFKKKVIYTAHGFHFFKGAPLFNRTVLKWIEMWLAHYTDILITINQEDFEASKKFKLKKGGKTVFIPGVGIDLSIYTINKTRAEIRESLSLTNDDFVCICMGDIISRKNYKTSIEAIANTNDGKIHYLICGNGPETENLKGLTSKLGISNQIHFLGFRRDIKDLLSASDCFLFSSLQEGLPRSTMEAMAAGLPCVVSDIRGNSDLIDDGNGGYLVKPTEVSEYSKALVKIKEDISLRKIMSAYNKEKIKYFDINIIEKKFLEVFKMI